MQSPGSPGGMPSLAPPLRPGPPPRRIAAAIGLAFLVSLSNSWSRDFWAPEEPDFAAVTKEMSRRIQEGDAWAWLVPTIGGQFYGEKPPLLYWCSLLIHRATGLDPRLAYRVPPALAGALMLAVTYLAGRRFFNARVGALAALVEGTTVLHLISSSWLLADMLFAAACALSVVSFGISLLQEPQRRRWSFLAWAALGVAALSKSALLAPVLVLGPVLLFAVTFAVARRDGPGLVRQLRALRPLAGAGIFLAMVAPWYVAVSWVHGAEFFREHLVEQHLLRLVDADSHARPVWYYLRTVIADSLPWSVFLPLTAFHAKVHLRHPGVRFFALWALWTFLVLSLVSSKQGKYLLPMWPALSVLVAASLLAEERESIWEEFLGAGVFRILGYVLRAALPFAVLLSILWPLGLWRRLLDRWGEAPGFLNEGSTMLWWIALALFASGGFFLAGMGISRRLGGKDLAVPAAFLGAATLFSFFLLTLGYGDLNPLKSARALCLKAQEIAGESPLAIYGRSRAAVHYYLDRPLLTLDRLDPLAASSPEERRLDDFLGRPERVYIIVGYDDLRKLRAEFPKYRERLFVVHERLRFGWHRAALIVSNRPG